MPTNNDAREYAGLMEAGERLGPHRLGQDRATLTRMQELAKRVHGAIEHVEEWTYRAPSAWHAAAWGLDLAALVGQAADIDEASGFKSPFPAKFGAPVFRGQRDPQWELLPTLLRQPRRLADALALEAFVSALSALLRYEENVMNGRYVHLAAAQHYGMSTALLDFTTDPRVAVSFACRGADPGSEVVVHCAPVNGLHNLGGAVVLPPPWVMRLYKQRGLFIDSSDLAAAVDLRRYCARILFPADPDFTTAAFPGGDATLLPPDPWFERAIAWARQVVNSGDGSLADPPGDALVKACGKPPFLWDALVPAKMQEWLPLFVDMCEWLALKAVNGQLIYDVTTMEIVRRHNVPLYRDTAAIWKFMKNQFSLGDSAVSDRTLAALQAVASVQGEAR